MQTGMNDLDNLDHIVFSLEKMRSILAQCPIIKVEYLGGGEPRTYVRILAFHKLVFRTLGFCYLYTHQFLQA